LGLELVDDLIRRGIRFSHLLADAWYGNSPDFIVVPPTNGRKEKVLRAEGVFT
jgi:hypothetical protein